MAEKTQELTVNVLLIWEEFSDRAKLFILNGGAADLALRAHGSKIGAESSSDSIAAELGSYLDDMEYTPVDDSKPFAGIEFDYIVRAGAGTGHR